MVERFAGRGPFCTGPGGMLVSTDDSGSFATTQSKPSRARLGQQGAEDAAPGSGNPQYRNRV
ncbi:hypothetical protein GCM10010278_37510 [Streptomyces melanogenes]|nr:hypothetical protein GCM10010278_37510 [Streptomyces melanogenes]